MVVAGAVATGAGAAAVGVGAVPVGVGAVSAGAGVVAVSGSVLARCGLGHRDASRHTHEHRRRHNTRKFLHLKLQLVLPRDRNRQRNPTTLPMQLSVPALKTDMEEGPGWVLCHEHRRSTRRCVTVREMKEGPSRSAIRC